MAGNETHNFDFVMEFSEQAYNELFATIFDTDGFLCSILQRIGAGGICGAFTVTVLMDRPTDVSLPAGARDTLDIRISLGERGAIGSLRMVAGVDVDRSDSGHDVIRVNFQDRLFFAEANIGGLSIPPNLVQDVLRNQVRFISLPGIPVDRTTSDPTKLRSADVRIIDDRSPVDLDASALLLTFGGGAAGNAAAFTQSFIPEGGRGGIALFFGWLCRIISPALEEALSLPDGSFEDCRLTRSVRIDEGNEVDLTRLELALDDGFIRVTAVVKKSGFCYEATGTVTAKLRIEVEDGRLIVQSEVEDPDIDVDIPWYCWVVGAVIGALLGGILFGVIGAIVGAVLVPLITWIASEVIEGIVERVASQVADAINDASPEVDTPAVGFNLIFQRVFIDGIVIKALVAPIDRAPIRSEGTLEVQGGQYIDLDSGKVGGETLPGADLLWMGFQQLKTVCNSALARTGSRSFESMTRSRLYTFNYESPAFVPLFELASFDPWGGVFTGDFFKETLNVYSVRTNEERYAAIRVMKVDDFGRVIRLQYRTYEKFLPTLELQGDFKCETVFFAPENAVVTFEPILSQRLAMLAGPAGLPRDVIEKSVDERLRLGDRRVGRWTAECIARSRDVGRFDAITNGLVVPLSYKWEIDGQTLEGTSGEIVVKGVTLGYTQEGGHLVLSPRQSQAIEFELKVTVKDATETVLTTSRCIQYTPECTQTVRYIPNWNTYQLAHLQHFGVAEVSPVRTVQ